MSGLNLPENLNAKVESVVSVNWSTYAFDVKVGKIGLGQLLGNYYHPKSQAIELESSNDTVYDLQLEKISKFDLEWAEKSKEEILEHMRNGCISSDQLNDAVVRAIIDGHLPHAKYLVSVSW